MGQGLNKASKILLWLISGAALTFIVLLVVGIYWTGVLIDSCGNSIEEVVASPNQGLKAVIFQRECGATTGFSKHVSIIPFDQQLENESGNVIRIDGLPSLGIQWPNDKTLTIEHDIDSLLQQPNSVSGVQIKLISKRTIQAHSVGLNADAEISISPKETLN